MRRYISNKITKIDIIGPSINLEHENKSTFKSYEGGCISIFILICFAVFIFVFGQEIYQRRNPNVTASSSKLQYSDIILDSIPFLFSLKLNDNDVNDINTYITLSTRIIYIDKYGHPTYTDNPINIEICDLDLYDYYNNITDTDSSENNDIDNSSSSSKEGDEDDKRYLAMSENYNNLNNNKNVIKKTNYKRDRNLSFTDRVYYCPRFNNTIISNEVDTVNSTTLEFIVSKCLITDKNKKCKSRTDNFSDLTLYLTVVNNFLNPLLKENAKIEKEYIQPISLSDKLYKEMIIELSKNTFTSDQGWLFESKVEIFYVNFERFKIQSSVIENDDLTKLSIKLSSLTSIANTERSYLKAQDLLAKIGGIMNVVYYLISFLSQSVIRFNYLKYVFLKVWDINESSIGFNKKSMNCLVNNKHLSCACKINNNYGILNNNSSNNRNHNTLSNNCCKTPIKNINSSNFHQINNDFNQPHTNIHADNSSNMKISSNINNISNIIDNNNSGIKIEVNSNIKDNENKSCFYPKLSTFKNNIYSNNANSSYMEVSNLDKSNDVIYNNSIVENKFLNNNKVSTFVINNVSSNSNNNVSYISNGSLINYSSSYSSNNEIHTKLNKVNTELLENNRLNKDNQIDNSDSIVDNKENLEKLRNDDQKNESNLILKDNLSIKKNDDVNVYEINELKRDSSSVSSTSNKDNIGNCDALPQQSNNNIVVNNKNIVNNEAKEDDRYYANLVKNQFARHLESNKSNISRNNNNYESMLLHKETIMETSYFKYLINYYLCKKTKLKIIKKCLNTSQYYLDLDNYLKILSFYEC